MKEIYRTMKDQVETTEKIGEVGKAEQILKHLTDMYEVSLAETNLNLALVDYNLAVTEHKLNNLTTEKSSDEI